MSALCARFKYEIDNFTHRLMVDDVAFEDAGEYTFQAGNQRATAYLYVQRKFKFVCFFTASSVAVSV